MKKDPKWKCVVCGSKQSLKRVYFEAPEAKDCRKVTQEFNMKRGEMAFSAPGGFGLDRRSGEEAGEDFWEEDGESGEPVPPPLSVGPNKWDLFVDAPQVNFRFPGFHFAAVTDSC